MKKGQVYEGIVGKIQFPNKARVIVEGEEKQAIVKNAITGQKIRFSINKIKKGNYEGRLLEVLEKSPLESKEMICPHYGICGGCLYQSIPYETQLKIKEQQVQDLLSSVVPSFEFEGIQGSPMEEGYRNKMEFSFGDEIKDGPLALGMHKRGSFYDIVTVKECRIADSDFRMILTATLQYFQQEQIPFYHKMRQEGVLRHLLIRKAAKTKEIMVALVTTTQQHLDLTNWKEKLLKLPLQGTITGILHIWNDRLADVVQSDRTEILYGRDYIEEELLGLRFQITPFSFFQTNSLGAEVLYQTVRNYIGETNERIVFDLYSGTGTIAQILAPVAKKVVGVEIVEEAVKAAQTNAEKNGLDNCYFLAGDVLKVIDEIEEKPDLIVLDPPRDGIHPKALKKIIQYGVERIVYVSCKPTSLVRDLQVLQESGYQVIKAKAVDMFPGTANVETVVLLSKGEVDSKKIRVEFSLEDMDMSEFQDGATYPQIKEYVLENTGLKVSNLYISQIKRKCGIEVGKNYNLPKSEDSRQPQCPPEKEKAIREAFKYFGMI